MAGVELGRQKLIIWGGLGETFRSLGVANESEAESEAFQGLPARPEGLAELSKAL